MPDPDFVWMCGRKLQMVKAYLNKRNLVLYFFMALMIFSSKSFPQSAPVSVNNEISATEEKKLRARIRQYLEFIRDEKWGSVYDMLLADPVEGRTRAKFIRDQVKDSRNPNLSQRFLQFDYRSSVVIVGDRHHERLRVSGCAKIRDRGKIKRYWATIGAGRNGTDEWLFVSLPNTYAYYDQGRPLPCK
jgi:hypothetical protein